MKWVLLVFCKYLTFSFYSFSIIDNLLHNIVENSIFVSYSSNLDNKQVC